MNILITKRKSSLMKLIEVIELKFLFYKGNTALFSNKGIVFANISV